VKNEKARLVSLLPSRRSRRAAPPLARPDDARNTNLTVFRKFRSRFRPIPRKQRTTLTNSLFL